LKVGWQHGERRGTRPRPLLLDEARAGSPAPGWAEVRPLRGGHLNALSEPAAVAGTLLDLA
jgi:hypothetical protein